jgi:hypothetical protein
MTLGGVLVGSVMKDMYVYFSGRATGVEKTATNASTKQSLSTKSGTKLQQRITA